MINIIQKMTREQAKTLYLSDYVVNKNASNFAYATIHLNGKKNPTTSRFSSAIVLYRDDAFFFKIK